MTLAQPGRAVVRRKSARAGKAVAAASVVCVTILSGCTAGQHSSVGVRAGTSLLRPGGMPGFYLVVAGLEVVVRADGHVTGTAAIPVPAAAGRAWVGGEAFGSADGRQFVIVMSQAGGRPGVAEVSLFRLTVSLNGRPGRLGQLPFDGTDEPVTGAALSPGPATARSPSPGGTAPPGIPSRPSSPESATSISRRPETTWPQRRWRPFPARCRSSSPR